MFAVDSSDQAFLDAVIRDLLLMRSIDVTTDNGVREPRKVEVVKSDERSVTFKLDGDDRRYRVAINVMTITQVNLNDRV